jgi:hypothetical protein
MSDQQPPVDSQHASEARVHIRTLKGVVCEGSFAHHSYWAQHHAAKIADAALRAQIEAEIAQAERSAQLASENDSDQT